MKIKALFLALVIAGATALSYTAITEYAGQALDKNAVKKLPRNG